MNDQNQRTVCSFTELEYKNTIKIYKKNRESENEIPKRQRAGKPFFSFFFPRIKIWIREKNRAIQMRRKFATKTQTGTEKNCNANIASNGWTNTAAQTKRSKHKLSS